MLGGGSCATTTSGGYKAERISETVPIMRPSWATRISAERCVSPSRLGARAMCAPALTHTRTLRWRRTVDPGAGSWPSTAPAGTFGSGRLTVVDAQLEVEARGEVGGVGDRLADEIGHGHLAGANRHAHRDAGKHEKGSGKSAREQEDLAVAPYPGFEGGATTEQWYYRRSDGTFDGRSTDVRRSFDGRRRKTPRGGRGTAASGASAPA